MKKGGILNPAICSLLAELGHMDELLIVDAGYPLPPDGHVIDLTLTPGHPPVPRRPPRRGRGAGHRVDHRRLARSPSSARNCTRRSSRSSATSTSTRSPTTSSRSSRSASRGSSARPSSPRTPTSGSCRAARTDPSTTLKTVLGDAPRPRPVSERVDFEAQTPRAGGVFGSRKSNVSTVTPFLPFKRPESPVPGPRRPDRGRRTPSGRVARVAVRRNPCYPSNFGQDSAGPTSWSIRVDHTPARLETALIPGWRWSGPGRCRSRRRPGRAWPAGRSRRRRR